jgi:hypothetical protein
MLHELHVSPLTVSCPVYLNSPDFPEANVAVAPKDPPVAAPMMAPHAGMSSLAPDSWTQLPSGPSRRKDLLSITISSLHFHNR